MMAIYPPLGLRLRAAARFVAAEADIVGAGQATDGTAVRLRGIALQIEAMAEVADDAAARAAQPRIRIGTRSRLRIRLARWVAGA